MQQLNLLGMEKLRYIRILLPSVTDEGTIRIDTDNYFIQTLTDNSLVLETTY